ncbi:putative membrane protein [Nocardioides scoriae]|uniref:Putative membrane protein n=1 Tax=Nocardioides scoriae TaxID=642780 RepID=A0A1H1STA9_9ACTN|nr:DUF202 domain-containing protein [Nocardioides scoriae]SDS51161.1 putative membrane protein [Nocardioides scoriae]
MAEVPAAGPAASPAPRPEPDVRFSLANERTLLAYQRTSVGLLAAAVAIVHFLDDDPLVVVLGLSFVATSAVAAVGGYLRFRGVDRAIREGRPIGAGPAAHLLSVAVMVTLLVGTAYVLLARV